jgi:hypothetical protein
MASSEDYGMYFCALGSRSVRRVAAKVYAASETQGSGTTIGKSTLRRARATASHHPIQDLPPGAPFFRKTSSVGNHQASPGGRPRQEQTSGHHDR